MFQDDCFYNQNHQQRGIFDFDTIDSSDKLGLVFHSLRYNRYHVAEAACKGSDPLDLQNAVKFLTKKTFKEIEDLPRAFNILKSIMQSDADRVAFWMNMLEIVYNEIIDVALDTTSSSELLAFCFI